MLMFNLSAKIATTLFCDNAWFPTKDCSRCFATNPGECVDSMDMRLFDIGPVKIDISAVVE